MPNIEIHGLAINRARDLRFEIFSVFNNEPYVKEMVVTIFPTQVLDMNGETQPFLRLVNDCQKNTKRIIGKLKKFGLDIEHARLEKFYPKVSVSKCASKKASYPSAEQLRGRLLGKVLIKMGVLTRGQVNECLKIQESKEGRIKIGQIFLELGLVNEKELEHALASQK